MLKSSQNTDKKGDLNMQARRAARELALILLSQLDKKIINYSTEDFDDIILKSVRILSNNTLDELKLTTRSLVEMKDNIETYEAEHETNLARPIGAKNKPVPIPMTTDMVKNIENMLEIAEKAIAALEIAEFTTLESHDDVRNYVIKIAETYKKYNEAIDNEIKKYASGWDFSRLVKMDKDILRIAITELLYIQDAPIKVVVDEALELAKKYSTDDSSSFINGILAKVIADNGVK